MKLCPWDYIRTNGKRFRIIFIYLYGLFLKAQKQDYKNKKQNKEEEGLQMSHW